MQSVPILRQARDYPHIVCVPLQPATLSRLLFQAKLEDDVSSVSQPEYAEQTEVRLAKVKTSIVFEFYRWAGWCRSFCNFHIDKTFLRYFICSKTSNCQIFKRQKKQIQRDGE